MTTITRTYTENLYTTDKSTWTVEISENDQSPTINSNGYFQISAPTILVKYTSSVTKGYVSCSIDMAVDINGLSKSTYSPNMWDGFCYTYKTPETYDSYGYPVLLSLAKNTLYNISVDSTLFFNKPSVPVTTFFNSDNPTERSVDLYAYIGYSGASSSSHKNGMYTDDPSVTPHSRNYNACDFADSPATNLGKLTTLILNAPPTVRHETPTYSNPQYTSLGVYSVTITRASAQYGGNIQTITLTVGSDSVTQNYSTATVTNQTFSVTPSVAGDYIPMITVTDTREQVTTVPLPRITVNPYNAPSINFDVQRCIDIDGHIGIPDIEGEKALVIANISYTKAVANLIQPTVLVQDRDGNTIASSATWYETWTAQNGVNNAVDWTNYNPNNPLTLYAVVSATNATLSQSESYSINITPADNQGGNAQTITQTLPTSFFTIDFQAGGKEIAFGAPANDDLTNINGKNYLDEGLFKCNMGTSFNDMTTGVGGEVEDFISELDINGAGIELTQADWIVEQGTNGMWIWRKWQSGLAECWGQYSYTSSTSTVWSAPLYYSDSVSAQPYPFTFKSIPMEWASVDSSTNALWLYKESSGHNTVSSTAVYRPIKVSAFSSNTFDIRYYVVGRWK